MKVTLILKRLGESHYESFLKQVVQTFAEGKSASEQLPFEEARAIALSQIAELLPDRQRTSEHLFFQFMDAGRIQGFAWGKTFAMGPVQKFFLYHFGLCEEFHGRGLAKTYLRLLENHLSLSKVSVISLHVFRSNQRALQLYQSAGFQIEEGPVTSGFKLSKKLPQI